MSVLDLIGIDTTTGLQKVAESGDTINYPTISGGVSDGDKGDITVSGGGIVWTIDNGVVTEAKQLLADNTTNDVSTSMHGYVPKATGETTKFLRADGSWAAVPDVEAAIPLTQMVSIANQTITAGYSAYVSGFYEIGDGFTLEIGDGSVFEIG